MAQTDAGDDYSGIVSLAVVGVWAMLSVVEGLPAADRGDDIDP